MLFSGNHGTDDSIYYLNEMEDAYNEEIFTTHSVFNSFFVVKVYTTLSVQLLPTK